jgi:hypothetical protein
VLNVRLRDTENGLDESRGVQCIGDQIPTADSALTSPQEMLGASQQQTLLELTVWTPLNSQCDFNRDSLITKSPFFFVAVYPVTNF